MACTACYIRPQREGRVKLNPTADTASIAKSANLRTRAPPNATSGARLGAQCQVPDPRLGYLRSQILPQDHRCVRLARSAPDRRPHETAESWTGKPAPHPLAPDPAPAKAARITIADAFKVFIANRESAGLARATLRKNHSVTKQLAATLRAVVTSCSIRSRRRTSISGAAGAAHENSEDAFSDKPKLTAIRGGRA